MNEQAYGERGKSLVTLWLCLFLLIFWALLGSSYLDEVHLEGALRYLWVPIGIIWVPGAILAAIIFPGGIHSNDGVAYVWLSMFIDAVLWAWVLTWAWQYVRKHIVRRTARRRRDIASPSDFQLAK